MLLLSGHLARVHTLAFAPDGRTLASVAGRGNRIWLWDLEQGRPAAQARHGRRVVSLAFTPGEGPVLACADSSGNVTLWDLASGKERQLDRVEPPPGHPIKLTFSADGRLLGATGLRLARPVARHYYPYARPRGVTLWDWQFGKGFAARRLESPAGPITSLAFAPDGMALAAGSLGRHVYLWPLGEEGTAGPAALNHGDHVHFVAYAPDGRSLASATQNGLVRVWDAQTGRKRVTLKGQGKFLHALAYSPDGRTLATASGDGAVRFWDAETGRPLRAFDWGVGPIHSVAFAPDGMRAAAGGERDIVVWDIDDWG